MTFHEQNIKIDTDIAQQRHANRIMEIPADRPTEDRKIHDNP